MLTNFKEKYCSARLQILVNSLGPRNPRCMFESSAAPLAIKSDTYEQCPRRPFKTNFTFGIVSIRRYFKIAREHFATIWNNDANNEGLLIIKHGKHLYFSAEMIAPSKLTAQKNKMAPATCVVDRSTISQFMLSHS